MGLGERFGGAWVSRASAVTCRIGLGQGALATREEKEECAFYQRNDLAQFVWWGGWLLRTSM